METSDDFLRGEWHCRNERARDLETNTPSTTPATSRDSTPSAARNTTSTTASDTRNKTPAVASDKGNTAPGDDSSKSSPPPGIPGEAEKRAAGKEYKQDWGETFDVDPKNMSDADAGRMLASFDTYWAEKLKQ